MNDIKRDIHKFSEWLEQTLKERVADEQVLYKLKVEQKRAEQSKASAAEQPVKAG